MILFPKYFDFVRKLFMSQDLFSVLLSSTKFDELELLLHGLNLGYLNDIMAVSTTHCDEIVV